MPPFQTSRRIRAIAPILHSLHQRPTAHPHQTSRISTCHLHQPPRPRHASTSTLRHTSQPHHPPPRPSPIPRTFLAQLHRTITTTPPHHHATPPPPPAASPSPSPTPLTPETYHALSDAYIDALVAQLEELQEARDDVDVEYSAGVLTLVFPPTGTYVLNKQPPNKQIWLSSPVSGPKRYDWRQKEGEEGGEWVYLRDGSTLSGLLSEELGIEIGDS